MPRQLQNTAGLQLQEVSSLFCIDERLGLSPILHVIGRVTVQNLWVVATNKAQECSGVQPR